jgi:integrase
MKRKPKSIMPLLEYVEQHFIPEKKNKGVDFSASSKRFYRSSAMRFCTCFGKALSVREVTDAKLATFESWLLANGHKAKTASSIVSGVRSIARHWDPKRWSIIRGRQTLSWHNADETGTLEKIFHDDYLPERTRIGSVQTIRQYGRCLRLFGEYLERPAVLADLTDKVVGTFLRWLVDHQGVKVHTANGYVKQIKAIWNWAAKKRLVKLFPTIEKLPAPKSIPIAWTEAELRQLIDACRKMRGTIGDWRAADIWLAFHHLLWDSGERTGAMLAMRWEWLSWEDCFLLVPGEFRKGRQKPMVYHLKPQTIAALEKIREPQRDLMFGMISKNHQFYARYKQLVTDAGLQYVPHKTAPQKMRRTYASFIEANGGNATRALKHVDRRVTEESYLDPRIAETHQENERLFSLDGDAA